MHNQTVSDTDLEFIEALLRSPRSQIVAEGCGIAFKLDGEDFGEVKYPHVTSIDDESPCPTTSGRTRGRHIRKNGEVGRSWRHG